MSFWRVLLSILLPPLAVLDKGCGSVLIVLILTFLGWIPGVIAALIILNQPAGGAGNPKN
ncbi:MAG: YqaE/Pmp3 family membrane protein [Flavobacteriaceae bacterium]|nr:YqaE/Pmp3 family membrane protein [Flavobacteriaceae bacterium]